MAARQRYKGVVLAKRVLSLPDNCTTVQVRTRLQVAQPTISRWLADKYFRDAGVVSRNETDGRWMWNPEMLYLWLIAIGSLSFKNAKMRIPANNPICEENFIARVTREEAREQIGMPIEYRIRDQGEDIEDE